MREIVTPEGRLVVADSAVAAVARAGALRCPGVEGTVKRGLPEEIRYLLGHKTGTARDEGDHGVEVELDQKRLTVEIGIIVRFGEHIPTIARQVVGAVEADLVAAFDLRPQHISVRVLGVSPAGERPVQPVAGEALARSVPAVAPGLGAAVAVPLVPADVPPGAG